MRTQKQREKLLEPIATCGNVETDFLSFEQHANLQYTWRENFHFFEEIFRKIRKNYYDNEHLMRAKIFVIFAIWNKITYA